MARDFYVDDLDNALLTDLTERWPDYIKVYAPECDMTRPVYSRINNIVKQIHGKADHIKLAIEGFLQPTGGGKSYASMSLASCWPAFKEQALPDLPDIYFNLGQIVSNRNKLLTRISSAPHIVISDEIYEEFGVGVQMKKALYQRISETTRKKQLSIITASNIIKPELSGLAHLILQTLPGGIDFANQNSRLAVLSNQKTVLGHVYIPSPVSQLGKEFITCYEEKKDKYLDEVFGLMTEGGISHMANQVMESGPFKIILENNRKRDGTISQKLSEKLIQQCVDDVFPDMNLSISTVHIARKIQYLLSTKQKGLYTP